MRALSALRAEGDVEISATEALARLRAAGAAVDDAELRRLIDFDLLVPPERLARHRR